MAFTRPRTLEEQTNSLANWLPNGRAWAAKAIEGTVMRALLEGMAGELIRNAALVEEFRQKILPDETTLFLDEWERAVGIPDDCFDGAGTDDERRNDVLAKLASLGVQTAEDMRLLALRIYGLEITITTPDVDPANTFPYTFNPTGMADPGGDAGFFTFGISEKESKFEVLLGFENLPNASRFPYTFPIQFGVREVAIVECLLSKLKPINVKLTPIDVTSVSIPVISEFSLEFNGDDKLLRSGQTGADEVDFEMPASGGEFSLAVWAKPIASDTNGLLIGFWSNGTSGNRMELYQDADAGTLSCLVVDDSAGNAKVYSTPGPDYTEDTWVHFVATYDGGNAADSLKLYVNGVYDSSPTKTLDQDTSALTTLDCVASVGDSEGAGGGQGCQHRIFSASAWDVELTADEIAGMYNEGDGQFDLRENVQGYASAASLKGWWLPGRTVSPNLGADLGTLGIPLVDEVDVYDSNRVMDVPKGS